MTSMLQIMPHTVENRVIRSFTLEGDYAGAEAVDFWTRVNVLGFDTGYLLRIAHLSEPQSRRFRSFWTLVDNPAQLAGLCGAEKTPCENDLALNLGSHQFEPYPGNPNYTLHTYTLNLSPKNWLQQMAIRLGVRKTMEEVTQGSERPSDLKSKERCREERERGFRERILKLSFGEEKPIKNQTPRSQEDTKMKRNTLFAFLAVVLMSWFLCGTIEAAGFFYNGDNGPGFWAELDPAWTACAGDRQRST